MHRKGCSIVELLIAAGVVLAMAGAAGAFTLGNQKAKEAETKQNIHAIQLAVERYAVDLDGNFYPYYLYGGDAACNIGTVNCYNPAPRNGAQYWDQPIHHPFDTHWVVNDSWDYQDTTWEELTTGEPPMFFGDPTSFEGYLPKYPSNPFVNEQSARRFSIEGLSEAGGLGNTGGFAGYGGRDGTCMWNLGCFGELPQLASQAYADSEPRCDFPGNFYYHPRWGDLLTNAGHLEYQSKQHPGSWWPGQVRQEVRPPLNDAAQVLRAEVVGYDLAAFGPGGPKSPGMDLDNSVAAAGYAHFFRTGYLTSGGERNPWVTAGAYGDNPDYAERPYSDGVPDCLLIHLGSSQISQNRISP